MHTAFVIDRFRPGRGGLETWLEAFSGLLVSRGHEVSILSRDRQVSPGPWLHVPVAARGVGRAPRDLEFARNARDAVSGGRFDVVVGLRHCLACDVYFPHGGSVPATFEARRRVRRGPSLPSPRIRNFHRLERELLTGESAPAAVIAVSDSVQRDLAARYPEIAERVTVVPNGVDLDRYSPGGREAARGLLVPGGGRVVAFVAGDPRLKGWRSVREVFRDLKASGDADLLLVAGGKPGRLPDGARYLGRLEDISQVLKASDLLLYPTWYDPFPLVTLESLACGTPVATTEQNGALDHVGRDGPVRAVAGPTELAALAENCRTLLSDPPREGARAVAERFPIADSLRRAADLIEEAAR